MHINYKNYLFKNLGKLGGSKEKIQIDETAIYRKVKLKFLTTLVQNTGKPL